jgi:DNA polymerase III subunit gamma/tau
MPTPLPQPTPQEMVVAGNDEVEVDRTKNFIPEPASINHSTEESPAEAIAEPAVAPAPAPAVDLQPSGLPSAEALQKAAMEILLDAKNQDTPADAVADAVWVVTDTDVRVQTELSKTMLPMVINAEAERLIKTVLRNAGAGALKLVLLPGVKTAAAKKPRAAKSGSVQAKAMEHPIVQRAQTLFNAEIRNVIDLRDND